MAGAFYDLIFYALFKIMLALGLSSPQNRRRLVSMIMDMFEKAIEMVNFQYFDDILKARPLGLLE